MTDDCALRTIRPYLHQHSCAVIMMDTDCDAGLIGGAEKMLDDSLSSAPEGAEPCTAERRRRRNPGHGRLNFNSDVRSSFELLHSICGAVLVEI